LSDLVADSFGAARRRAVVGCSKLALLSAGFATRRFDPANLCMYNGYPV